MPTKTRKTTDVFEGLVQLAQDRCLNSMKALKIPDQTQEQLVRALRSSAVQMDHQMVFMSVIMQLMSKKGNKDPLMFNSFVRDFQAFSNHVPHYESNKTVASGFLFGIYGTLESESRNVPKDIPEYIALALDAHVEIDEWIRAEKQEAKKRTAEGEFSEDSYLEYSSIAHHVLDWYLMVSPYNAYRKTPQQLAALAYGIVNRVNSALGKNTLFANTQLADFGGWKNISSFSVSLSSPFYDVVYSVEDLPLLFLNPTKLPKSWQKRMHDIAPALEQEVLGPSDL